MKSKIIARIIFFLLIIATLTAIFNFSNQDGQKSKSVSTRVMRQIVDIYPKTKNLTEKEKNQIVEKSQPFIRKTAHFTIYMISGIMMMAFLSTYNVKWYKRIIITCLFGLMYAITDELHQGITGGGRTPRIFDVCIDTLGTLTGATFVLGILLIASKMMNCIRKSSV